MKILRYGILDDEGQVIRWTYDQPQHGDYIRQLIPALQRTTPYQIALARCGEAPF